MTRQIIINIQGMDHMLDAEIERIAGATVFHISGGDYVRNTVGKEFDVVMSDENDLPLFRPESQTAEGKTVMEKVWEQLQALPPQLKGGRDTEKI